MHEPDLVDAYLGGIEALRLAVSGLTEEQLRNHPIAGTWSVQEVVCHLADSEGLFTERMKRVLSEERPAMLFSDPNQQVRALAYDARDVAEEVALIGLMRRQMGRILREQPPDAWRRVGVHSTEGDRTLEQLVRKAINHLEHHLEFVRAKRRAMEVGGCA